MTDPKKRRCLKMPRAMSHLDTIFLLWEAAGSNLRLEEEEMSRFSKRRWIALAGGVLGLSVGGIAYATIPGASGVISACYQTQAGELRVIDAEAGAKCRAGETPLSWNQAGQQGQPGLSGHEIREAGFTNDPNAGDVPTVTGEVACSVGKSVLGGGGAAESTRILPGGVFIRDTADLLASVPVSGDNAGWRVVVGKRDGSLIDERDTIVGTVYAICAFVVD